MRWTWGKKHTQEENDEANRLIAGHQLAVEEAQSALEEARISRAELEEQVEGAEKELAEASRMAREAKADLATVKERACKTEQELGAASKQLEERRWGRAKMRGGLKKEVEHAERAKRF